MEASRIGLIGAGRMGTSLGLALVAKGYAIRALSCRKLSSARQSRRIIGQGSVLVNNAEVARSADVLFLCLPDEEIPKATARLARARIDWSNKTVFHTSGLLPASVLSSLHNLGASVASFHPIQSFPRKDTPPTRFKDIYVGVEGDKQACRLAMTICRKLGARPFFVTAITKPAYHAACSIASNLLVGLLDAAFEALRKAGVAKNKTSQLLFPLVEGTLQNVKELDIQRALTGPVIRGDISSVEKHLQSLRSSPEIFRAYKSLSLLALKQAEKSGLPRSKVRALRNLLEGK